MNHLSIALSYYSASVYAPKKYVILLLVLQMFYFSAKSQRFDWAKSDGITTGIGYASGSSICTDQAGNVYTVGQFQGTVDFDPSPGVFTLTSALQGLFIQKLDKNGNFIWAINCPGIGAAQCLPKGIFADSFGHIFVSGQFSFTVDFDPGIGTFPLTTPGDYNIFILKIDTLGNFKWAKSIGGIGSDAADAITGDQYGNVYVTGSFSNTVDFDPGPGLFSLSSIDGNCFLEKLDSSGNFIFAKSVVASTSSGAVGVGHSLVLDHSGYIYITGEFKGNCDFDPGTGTFYMSAFGGTAYPTTFISKLDPLGNLVWAKKIGGSSSQCYGLSIAVDASGNIFTTGYFDHTIDLDPGTAVYNVTSLSVTTGFNTYIVKLNSSGILLWGQLLASMGRTQATALQVDKSGNVYTTGTFSGSVDFDPGPGTYYLIGPVPSSSYSFLQKLDGNGNFIWAGDVSGSITVDIWAIALDQKANIYLTGGYKGTYDFDPGPGTYNITSSGGNVDLFVEKLDQTKYAVDTISACGSYVAGGTTITTSGIYLDTLSAFAGMDSITTLSLTINTVPNAGTISGTDSVCHGASVTLTESVSGGIWHARNANATVSAGVVAGVTAGLDTILYIVSNTYCSDTAFFPIKVKSCTVTGLPGVHENEQGIRVYPNPNDGYFTLFFNSGNNLPERVSITNTLGQRVKEFNAIPNTGTPVTLDLPSGMYFISIIDMDNNINRGLRLVVVR